MEKKGNALNLLTLSFWYSLIVFFFNLMLVLGRFFPFVSNKSCVMFLKFSRRFKLSVWLVFQRPSLAFQPFRLWSPLSLWKMSTFPAGAILSSLLPVLMSVPLLRDKCLREISSSEMVSIVRRISINHGLEESGVTEILLRWSQKTHSDVCAFEDTYFSWGANFPYVQINPFMATADVFCRWYPVLQISQPLEKSVKGGIVAWSCVQGVMA